jgi:hypothetical protein
MAVLTIIGRLYVIRQLLNDTKKVLLDRGIDDVHTYMLA